MTAALPLVVAEDALDFGALQAGGDGMLHVAFDLPDGTLAIVLTVDPGPRACQVRLLELDGPDGERLYDDGAAMPRFEPVSSRSQSPWFPFSVMLPSAPDLRPASGTYAATLWVEDPDDSVTVDVVLRRAAEVVPTGRIGVALWFAAGARLDAASAVADADFAAAIKDFSAIFAEAGIVLDPIRLADLSGDAAFAEVRDDAALRALTAALEPADESALEYVFVEHLDVDGRASRGRATGIPVPPRHPRLARRGIVAIALDMLPARPERQAELFAHEGAHALGLGHTSEFDGLRHDPIADTPECPRTRASQTTGAGELFLAAEDCADLDGYNLLFPIPPMDTSPQRRLSEGQVEMLRANPSILADR